MSKRSEAAALTAYPKDRKGVLYDLARKSIIQGYEQAEKDLALTGEDMRLAFKAVNDALDNCDGKTRAEVLEDALQRFNEQRKK